MKPKTNIFFTSDWHLGHANVIKFDQRPFRDLDHMHSVLINNYNSSVTDNDVCYFLGDVGFAKGDVVKEIISKLNGTKVLLLGNHDKNTFSMYDQGFDVVLNTAVFYLDDKRISMSHCPLPGIKREDVTGMKGAQEGENWHGEFKNQRFTSYDMTVDYHLSGHIHSGPHCNKKRTLLNQFDIGVAANSYRPVSLSVIESWINQVQKGTWVDE